MRPADIMRMEPTGVAEIVPRTRTCSKSPAALPAAVPLLGSGGVTLDWLKGSIAFVTTAPLHKPRRTFANLCLVQSPTEGIKRFSNIPRISHLLRRESTVKIPLLGETCAYLRIPSWIGYYYLYL